MRNNNKQKGTTMIDFEHGMTENVDAEDAHNTTWSECDCEHCQPQPVASFANTEGDGPSGFDYWHDTRRWC